MNPRERLLALVVGALMGLILLYAGLNAVWGWFDSRTTQIDSLRRDLKKKKEELVKAQIAASRLTEYEAGSLPRELDVAQSAYQSWLMHMTHEAKLSEVNLTALKPRSMQRTYQAIGYTLTAEGTLPQFTQWLHRFQQADQLHRLDSFSLKPLKDSKSLLVNLSLTALSLNSTKVEKFEERTRTDYPALLALQTPILQRNMFAPPNQAPRFDSSSPPVAYLGRSWEWSPKVQDSDKLDRVSVSLVGEAPPGLKLDASAGRLSWSPTTKGEYQFTLSAMDDGLPSLESKREFKVSVTDPPPPPPMVTPPPPKLAFDAAKYTFLMGAIAVNNEPEAWLHIRQSGEVKKLREGDRFTIGSITGRITRIDERTMIFECEGKLRQVDQDHPLFDAKTLEAAPLEN